MNTLRRRSPRPGITRSQLIVQAVDRALTDQSAWSSDFLKAIGSPRPELEEALDAMMDAVRARRSRNDAPGL
jgi:hypothetical protein